MRLYGLTLLALITGCLGVQEARASSDDSCYPSWNLKRDSLDVCNSLPFLSPGNDSRVNLQLLLADAGQASIPNHALTDDEQQLGYGQVPFPLARWLEGAAPGDSTDSSSAASTAPLADLAARIGLPADAVQSSADSFASGEGSRCRSNNAGTAQDFLSQLLLVDSLSAGERQGLARARLTLLGACQWDETQLSVLLPGDLQSAPAKAYRSYLKGAADFYSGRFGDALKSFRALQDSDQPWLKETSRYMVARALLNQAQQNAFDEMGYPDLRKVDKKILAQAETTLGDYLKAYPQGRYSASAKGLTRRVYWLMSDESRLAGEYAELFAREDADDLAQLVQEVDNKLLVTAHPADVRDARLLAVLDLMQMRHHEPSEPRALDAAGLAAQKDLFAKYPGLHDYLTAAFLLYVEEKPAEALKSLPAELPAKLDYLAFSQQTLRGFALEAGNDWIAAEKLWLRLLPLAEQPLQREQLELALAFNYERSDRLVKVFAEGSPVHTPIIRETLLRHVAGPDLLRQQAKSTSISVEERDTALFALLYKDLLHGQYQAYIDDLALLPTDGSGKPLGASIGYLYGSMPLSLFQWPGGKNDSGYECPAIVDVARDLLQNPQPPKALNCLGEFILRNGLDGFPLDTQPSERELGGGESLFPGTPYSRMDGYLKVIADKQAVEEDRAYALFRAINCFAPSGYNGCGSQDIAPSQRKQWFRTLKGQYSATPWAKSLKYYW
ncbi:outer membrane assembly lipoprotein YfiO [Pseudomonas nitroreducens]|uniref:Outer membrane assembly lipoprotein YfiO n=1 Tax=Pseudomonas nitroreducens TaxID=46680 RepID=A0A5R9AF40_PSENT|nr:outer membrane assembly lipoprotein YfiO [Pseudomonas nitroreducens]TLP76645.1 outer membrane assembly lipoprotein YfiO [Pseudomonas nitroreducens]